MLTVTKKKPGSSSVAFSCLSFLILGSLLGFFIAEYVDFQAATTTTTTSSSSNDATFGRVLQHEEVEEEGEAEGEGHHEIDETTLDITVFMIVVLLIILTIAFEIAKEHIEESADKVMKPILKSLFGEMTILGFLAVVTFVVTKLGFFEHLSIVLFGEEEELLETFEFVHFMLFFIMLFFVISVLTLMAGAKQREDDWKTMNVACRNKKYMEQLIALEGTNGVDVGSKMSYFLSSNIPVLFPWQEAKNYRQNLHIFHGIRNEFLLERSIEPPFAPIPEQHRIGDDFDFGRYLSLCLGHVLCHAVHVSNISWAFFAVLTLVYSLIIILAENDTMVFAWVWAGSGWVLVVASSMFEHHILTILQAMTTPLPSSSSAEDGESSALLPSSSLPAWTKIDLSPGSKMTRQDTLYWRNRKGPKMYSIFFQIQLVFTSAYIALLVMSLYPLMLFEQENISISILYLVLSVLPVYLQWLNYSQSAANMAMACCIGIHRKPHVVGQVIREGKVDHVIRAMVTMQQLQLGADAGFPHSSIDGSTEMTDSQLAEISKTFDALDTSGDGYLQRSELKSVLAALGAPTTEESLTAIVKLLDKNNDGQISKDEFLDFYKAHVRLDVHDHDLHELAHHMFKQFDKDNSGEITLGEFKVVLDAFNVGFSVDEIGDLVNALDEGDNGTIGEHEFVDLLENHDHLFEAVHLPLLE